MDFKVNREASPASASRTRATRRLRGRSKASLTSLVSNVKQNGYKYYRKVLTLNRSPLFSRCFQDDWLRFFRESSFPGQRRSDNSSPIGPSPISTGSNFVSAR